MKPQHTPGLLEQLQYIANKAHTLAGWKLEPAGYDVSIGELNELETKARESITAVTDLLQACKDLEQIASLINARQHSGRLINAEDWCELYDRCNQAKSAISKAEGKE